MNLGYAIGSAIFLCFFLVTATLQILATSFHPLLYWTAVVATTTAGTTMADYADRSLGIGYIGGSVALCIMLTVTLSLWRFSLGSLSINTITSRKAELFYWLTILFSNTLGTALGDFLADGSGLGYEGSALVFSAALLLITITYFTTTNLSRTFLFWTAFILTRPLGATVGDLLTKPYSDGGFDLSRISSSLVLTAFMVICIFITSQKAGHHPGKSDS
jgi:uncharacterized membrane-anchored protein